MSDYYGPYDIGPASELQKKYGWYAKNWEPQKFDLDAVPQELRDLIPLAARWGITCDITRRDAGEKASREELADVARLLEGRRKQVYSWLYSDRGNSPEAIAFSALLVFEMEEANGPGIPGLLDWRIQEYNDAPTELSLRKLRDAYNTVKSWDRSTQRLQPMAEAAEILKDKP
jgi:hypothetical protein